MVKTGLSNLFPSHISNTYFILYFITSSFILPNLKDIVENALNIILLFVFLIIIIIIFSDIRFAIIITGTILNNYIIYDNQILLILIYKIIW